MPRPTATHCKDCKAQLTELNGVYNRHSRLCYCRFCWNKRMREYNASRKGITTSEWHKYYHLEKTYGITKDGFEAKLQLQLNGCAICKLPFNDKRVMVDHDHTEKQLRDLLCGKCNTILGLLNDDEDYIWNILEYLKRHRMKTA